MMSRACDKSWMFVYPSKTVDIVIGFRVTVPELLGHNCEVDFCFRCCVPCLPVGGTVGSGVSEMMYVSAYEYFGCSEEYANIWWSIDT